MKSERQKRQNQWKILLRSKFNHNIFNCAINHSREKKEDERKAKRGKLQSEKRELKFPIHFVTEERRERGKEAGKKLHIVGRCSEASSSMYRRRVKGIWKRKPRSRVEWFAEAHELWMLH
jgi:hypothetical protein